MNARDLMIGDYIMFNKNTYIIEEISKKGWVHLIDNDGSECHVELSSDYILDAITPIPLTAEILEKNGFWCERNVGYVMEEYEYEIIYDSWDHKLRILKNRKQILNLEFFDEMCVHELQHALRLCGIDKEIKL